MTHLAVDACLLYLGDEDVVDLAGNSRARGRDRPNDANGNADGRGRGQCGGKLQGSKWRRLPGPGNGWRMTRSSTSRQHAVQQFSYPFHSTDREFPTAFPWLAPRP